MTHPIRAAAITGLVIAVFALLSHLGGMYFFHEHYGPGALFTFWSHVLWFFDVPARIIFSVTGIGLRFEYFDMNVTQLVLDLTVYTVVVGAFWFGTISLILVFVARIRARRRET